MRLLLALAVAALVVGCGGGPSEDGATDFVAEALDFSTENVTCVAEAERRYLCTVDVVAEKGEGAPMRAQVLASEDGDRYVVKSCEKVVLEARLDCLSEF